MNSGYVSYILQSMTIVQTCLYACLHTYIRTYIIHTYINTYVRTYIIHTYLHTYIHTYIIHTYLHTYVHTYLHTYMHTCKHIRWICLCPQFVCRNCNVSFQTHSSYSNYVAFRQCDFTLASRPVGPRARMTSRHARAETCDLHHLVLQLTWLDGHRTLQFK